MSRGNLSITPLPSGSIVCTFTLRQGGTAEYTYSGDAAAAILAGADPKDFPYDDGGVSVDASDILDASEVGEAAGAAEEIGGTALEIGELGAL
ncbi:MAG TPA: hypothetical protein VMF66_07150 [Candidatus Acidoferrum sp.]|nr:hypothetical protein [Candidatus Acidoferrum sp.]